MTNLDQALVRARDGDEEGFLVLWRCFQPRLLRFLQVYVGRDVEDLAAETWLRVVRDLRSFRGDTNAFAAWLFTVARRRAIDAHRARQRRPELQLDELPEVATRTAEELALESISTKDALTMVSQLPRKTAEAVALNVIVGLDAPTTAAILGTTAGAVRVRVHRGLRTLETMLNPARTEVTA